MNGSWLTMLVKRLRTCTGESSASSPRSICAEDAEEHGQLHRRRGVEVVIGVVRPLNRRLRVAERDAEVLRARALS